MPKFFTLARRLPDVDIEEFRVGCRHYAHRVLADASADTAPRRMVLGFAQSATSRAGWDGVAITWYEEANQRNEWLERTTKEGHAAGLHDIVDVDKLLTIEVTERVVSGQSRFPWEQTDDSQVPPILLLGLIEKQSALTRKAFADYWWDKHRILADQILPPSVQPYAYIHNYVVDQDKGHWDGVAEMYELSLEGARERGALIKNDGMEELIVDEDKFLVRETREMLVFRGEVVSSG